MAVTQEAAVTPAPLPVGEDRAPATQAVTRPARRSHRRLWIGAGGLAVVAALVLGSGAVSGPAEAPAAQPAPVRLPYDARGRIVPSLQARVATIRGGVVRELPRVAGARVAARDELARLEAADGSIEVLSAPYGGTVLTVPVQLGDTVAPGQQVAVVGDLRELRVETTDVDEYLINRVEIGQPVELTVDALPGRTLNGRVAAVSLVAQAGAGGRLHYPVTVTLDRSDPSLRPSMTARLRFGGSSR